MTGLHELVVRGPFPVFASEPFPFKRSPTQASAHLKFSQRFLIILGFLNLLSFTQTLNVCVIAPCLEKNLQGVPDWRRNILLHTCSRTCKKRLSIPSIASPAISEPVLFAESILYNVSFGLMGRGLGGPLDQRLVSYLPGRKSPLCWG